MDQKNTIADGFIHRKFGFLGKDFLEELKAHGIYEKIEARKEIMREGDLVKYVLFLIKGAIKVYSLNDGPFHQFLIIASVRSMPLQKRTLKFFLFLWR